MDFLEGVKHDALDEFLREFAIREVRRNAIGDANLKAKNEAEGEFPKKADKAVPDNKRLRQEKRDALAAEYQKALIPQYTSDPDRIDRAVYAITRGWYEFTHSYAGEKISAESRERRPKPERVLQVNYLHDLAFGKGGAAAFLKQHGMPELPDPASPEEWIEAHQLKHLGDKESATRKKFDELEHAIVLAGEANSAYASRPTDPASNGYDKARADLQYPVNQRLTSALIEQWWELERRAGADPKEKAPSKRTAEGKKEIFKERVRIVNTGEGKLLYQALWALNNHIIMAQIYQALDSSRLENIREKIGDDALRGYLTDEAHERFMNALFSFKEGSGTNFSNWLLGGLNNYLAAEVSKRVGTERGKALPIDELTRGLNEDSHTSLVDPDARDPADLPVARENGEEERKTRVWLGAALKRLPEQQRNILTKRYGLNGSGHGHKKNGSARTELPTLNEIGNGIGLTRERVRQLEKKALHQLRAPYDEEALMSAKEKLRHLLCANHDGYTTIANKTGIGKKQIWSLLAAHNRTNPDLCGALSDDIKEALMAFLSETLKQAEFLPQTIEYQLNELDIAFDEMRELVGWRNGKSPIEAHSERVTSITHLPSLPGKR